MLKRFSAYIVNNPIKSIVGFSVFIRILILVLYNGYSIFPDSSGYIELARQLSNLDLTNYSGERTPGYPALIALLGNNLHLTILLQSLFGVINTYLLYKLVFLETKNIKAALLSAFIFTSFIHVLFYEVAILTETSALTIIILIFWLIKKYDFLNATISFKGLVFLSFLFGFSYLIKPMFIYIPLTFTICYIFKNVKQDFKKTIIKAFIVLIIPMLLFYSWSSLNQKNIGVFGSTYFLGFNLSQNATSFFEKAPDKDALIRDIFVKHRDSLVIYGLEREYAMSIWRAYDELLEKTKLSPPELSKKLGEISINLFKEYPILYLKQVGISWLDFWQKSILWKPKQIKSVFAKNVFMGTWVYIQTWLGLLINILFIVFSIKTIFQFFKSKCSTLDFELFAIIIVLLGSLAQALVTYGSNSRFSFPYLPLIIYIVVINLFTYKSLYATNTST